MSIFGDRLRFLREEKGLMGKELAKVMNVEPATITNWEKGNRSPKEDIIVKIADYFNCSTDFLLGRTNNRDAVIYTSEYNSEPIEIEIHKDYPVKLSKDDIINLINELANVGVDVQKLIEKSKKGE